MTGRPYRMRLSWDDYGDRGTMLARLGQVLYLAVCGIAISACTQSAQQAAQPPSPEGITIAVDKEGNFSWNGEPVSCEEIERRLDALPPNPEVAPPTHVPCDEFEKIKTGQ